MTKNSNTKEIATTSTEIALMQKGEAEQFNMSEFVGDVDLVLPTMSIAAMQECDVLAVRADSEIHYSEQIDPKSGEIKMKKSGRVDENNKPIMEPEMLPTIHATRLADGFKGNLVLPTIVHRGLKNIHPLTGLFFAMKKGASLGTGKATLWEVKLLKQKSK